MYEKQNLTIKLKPNQNNTRHLLLLMQDFAVGRPASDLANESTSTRYGCSLLYYSGLVVKIRQDLLRAITLQLSIKVGQKSKAGAQTSTD